MNNCNHIGNLVKDPETEQKSGTAVTKFSIAVPDRFDPTNNDKTDYLDFVAFGKTGEFIHNHFHKGKAIALTSRSNQQRWQDKETGKGRSKIEFIVENASFCGNKADNGNDTDDLM